MFTEDVGDVVRLGGIFEVGVLEDHHGGGRPRRAKAIPRRPHPPVDVPRRQAELAETLRRLPEGADIFEQVVAGIPEEDILVASVPRAYAPKDVVVRAFYSDGGTVPPPAQDRVRSVHPLDH